MTTNEKINLAISALQLSMKEIRNNGFIDCEQRDKALDEIREAIQYLQSIKTVTGDRFQQE